MLRLIGANLVFLEEKKSTLPGLEPGTDGLQAYRRDHCSIKHMDECRSFSKSLILSHYLLA